MLVQYDCTLWVYQKSHTFAISGNGIIIVLVLKVNNFDKKKKIELQFRVNCSEEQHVEHSR
jgi:hypothetical protein